MDRSLRLPHLPALDGLRGVAVLGVIAFHAGHLEGGYLGVDAFFVLSGFLITSLLLREHERTEAIGLGAFWARRARRLLPALYLMLVVVAASSLWWATPGEADRLRGDGIATVLYVANWHAIASAQSYWGIFETPSPLQHTWSLAIEEQFYLVWPLLVLAVAAVVRRRRRHDLATAVLITSGVGAVASAAALILLYDDEHDPSRVYFGTGTRAAAILIGAALAAWYVRRGTLDRDRPPRWLEVLGLGAIAWLVYAWSSIDGLDPLLYHGGLAASGVAVAVLLALTTTRRGPFRAAFAWRPLAVVGLVSYGLYLWHWPVFVILDEQRLGLGEPWLLPAQLAITTALTLASYWLLEQPIRRGALPGRPAQVLVAGSFVAVLAAVIVLPTLAADTGGPSSDDLARSLAVGTPPDQGPAAPDPSDPDSGPAGAPGSVPGSTTPTVDPLQAATDRLGRPPRVLIVGDSVGFTLARGLIPYQDQLGLQVESEAVIACGVARGSGNVRLPDGSTATEAAECHDWPTRWSDAIERFDPDLVLLVVGWPASTERDLDGTWRRPCDPVFDDWYRGEVQEALDVLTGTGTPVAMTNAAYWRSPKAPPESDPGVDCLNALYTDLVDATPGVELIDLMGYVCPDAPACLDTIDGVLLRDDGLHFNGPAGTLVGMWVTRQALAATYG